MRFQTQTGVWHVLSVAALLAIAPVHAAAPEKNDAGLPLPFWNEAAPGGPMLGGGLWPDDFKPGDIIHPALNAGISDDAGVPVADSWLRFLPRGLFSSRNTTTAPEPPLVDISAEALHACENLPATTRMLDPLGLLTEAQSEDLARLLAFHSESAGVGAGFLLLDTWQKLPAAADLSRLASGTFAHGSVCLVVYPLGAPHRARIFLTGHITEAVAPGYLEGLAAACIRDALETPDPVEQLQRFATQLSIRLFWLERAYPVIIKPEPVAASLPNEEIISEPLNEVTPAAPVAALEASKLQLLWKEWKPFILLAIAAVLTLALFIVMLRRWHQRRQRQTVWILPDYDHRHPVRYGGPHCGGNGVSVKYG